MVRFVISFALTLKPDFFHLLLSMRPMRKLGSFNRLIFDLFEVCEVAISFHQANH